MTRIVYIILLFVLIAPYSFTQNQISLDGEWEIIFDEKNEGRTAEWMKAETFAAQSSKQKIQVPDAWEKYKEDYEGVAFYKRAFDVPADWKNKVVRLSNLVP